MNYQNMSTFNSLYEILKKGCEKIRWFVCFSFNSLYEIPRKRRWRRGSLYAPFNSLYEILMGKVEIWRCKLLSILFMRFIAISIILYALITQLSILFMRFSGQARTGQSLNEGLSILFMRFIYSNKLCAESISSTFNSLYEIRERS